MGEWIKKILIYIAPYGLIEKYRRKQREKEREERQREREKKKAEEARKKEEAARRKEEARKKKFLQEKTSKKWGTFYAEYHEKEGLENHWILYEASKGIGMVGNPYAIFKAFLENAEFQDYVHIWAIKDKEELLLLQKEYQAYGNVVFIYYCSKPYAYFLSKSKYLINDSSFPSMFSKKEGQVFLNAWHGLEIAETGYDAEDGRRLYRNTIRNLLASDYIVSPNLFMTEVFEKSYRLANLFTGRYIQEGYPQRDLILETEAGEAFRKLQQRGIQAIAGKKIILYVPAWEGHGGKNIAVDEEEYNHFYGCLSEKINQEEYQIFIRLHPDAYKKLNRKAQESGRYIPCGMDMGEVLSVTDILVTDDPKAWFGFLAADRPILFYTPEQKLSGTAKKLYSKDGHLPGPYATDLGRLAENLMQADAFAEQYKDKREEAKEWACCRDGNVSKKIIEIVFQGKGNYQLLEAEQTGKKKILLFAGGFYADGVTSAALALLNSMDYQEFDVTVFVSTLKSEMQDYNFDKIPAEARVLLRCNRISMTEEQKLVYEMTMSNGFGVDPEYQPMQEYLGKREYSRCFGKSEFDYLIDFSGYGVYFSCFIAKNCPNAKKFIWQHTAMLQDMTNKKKRALKNTVTTIDSLLSVYPYYDKIVSASKAVCEVNRKDLETVATKGKFVSCGNLMDEEKIGRQIQADGSCKINGLKYLKVANTVMGNGVEEATLIPFKEEEKKYVRFVTMGRCMPEKNHRNLILAVNRLLGEGVLCKLYIIGDGQERKELESLIEELGIQGQVLITGFVTNPFVILKECDCFVFPSFYEAQGLAVLEARLVGLPIIVSNYPAVESVLLEDKQFLLHGTGADDIYQGLRAYLDGKVPDDYQFDIKDYNHKAYQEFEYLINDL